MFFKKTYNSVYPNNAFSPSYLNKITRFIVKKLFCYWEIEVKICTQHTIEYIFRFIKI